MSIIRSLKNQGKPSPKTKIILFDIDETLLSCGEANIAGSRVMFKRIFDIDASEESIKHTGKTEKAIIEEVVRLCKNYPFDQAVDIPNKAFQVWAEEVAVYLKTHPPKILPGVVNLLENLLNLENTLLGILTGNSRLRADIKLKAAGLDKFFRDQKGILRGAFGDISNKRSDLIFEAKEKYGEGTYILIDDSLIAAKMAKENNIPSILVATGHASEEQLKQYSEFVFKDFGENRWKEAIKMIECTYP